jgi:hypothetical protein
MDNGGKFQGWIATLSDGGIRFETTPTPGEKTPWQLLLDNLTKTGRWITQLRLQKDGFTVICDSQKNCDGYVQAREAAISLVSGVQNVCQGVGSIYGDKVFMTWVDDQKNIRQSVRDLKDLKIHSTLRDHHDTDFNTT